jgi:DNL zinc finger
MVVSTCRHCKNKHLIADNEGKLDMPEYGKKIEEYLQSKGETIQRLSITAKDLEDNYLIDKDGILTLVPKVAGQVCMIYKVTVTVLHVSSGTVNEHNSTISFFVP